MLLVQNYAVTSGAWTAVPLSGVRGSGANVRISCRLSGAFKFSHQAVPRTVYATQPANIPLTLEFRPSTNVSNFDEMLYVQSAAASDTLEVAISV